MCERGVRGVRRVDRFFFYWNLLYPIEISALKQVAMWGQVLLLVIPLAFVIAGLIILEQQKKVPDADKKVLGACLTTGGAVGLLFTIVILIYAYQFN